MHYPAKQCIQEVNPDTSSQATKTSLVNSPIQSFTTFGSVQFICCRNLPYAFRGATLIRSGMLGEVVEQWGGCTGGMFVRGRWFSWFMPRGGGNWGGSCTKALVRPETAYTPYTHQTTANQSNSRSGSKRLPPPSYHLSWATYPTAANRIRTTRK